MVGVSFVTLSQLQNDRGRFRMAFLRMLGPGALLTFPTIAGFGMLSSEIIQLLFGSRWAASGDIAKILTQMWGKTREAVASMTPHPPHRSRRMLIDMGRELTWCERHTMVANIGPVLRSGAGGLHS
jgi:hypothetical protein